MRTQQELMGHEDLATTQRYADYALNAHEEVYAEAAFGHDRPQGPVQRPDLSESKAISEDGSTKPNVSPEKPRVKGSIPVSRLRKAP